MTELVFLLEGESEEEMLRGFLPKILPESIVHGCTYIVLGGKGRMEKRLMRRLRDYPNPRAQFIVLRDQDSGDCVVTKQRLLDKCREAGQKALIRIACHELESWYLADLNAVEKGLGVKNLSRRQNESKYREPDRLGSPKNELINLTNKLYREVPGSRAIAPHLDPDNPRSRSFAVFVSGVRRMAAAAG